MSQRQDLVVFGYGLLFERRFGRALENARFRVVNALQEKDHQGQCVLVCFLDGPPLSLPDPDDPRLGSHCIWISDEKLPANYSDPAHVLNRNVSSETLLVYLMRLCPCGEDQRQDERYKADFRVQYVVPNRRASREVETSSLVDLSLGGAFIRSANPPPSGTRVRTEIEYDLNEPPISVEGRVVYALLPEHIGRMVRNSKVNTQVFEGTPGFAVAFTRVSFETRSALQRAIRRLNRDEDSEAG